MPNRDGFGSDSSNDGRAKPVVRPPEPIPATIAWVVGTQTGPRRGGRSTGSSWVVVGWQEPVQVGIQGSL